ncbi:MAG: hypothetical protein AAF927_18460 [Bacteroidota bacterium]
MKYRPYFLLLLLLILSSPYLRAQELVQDHSFGERLSLHLAIGNHSVGFPLQNQFKAFNPALSQLGITVRLNRSTKHSLLLGLSTSGIRNEVVGNSWLLGLELAYRYRHPSGVYTQLGLEMGALSQRSVREAYSFPFPSDDFQPEQLSLNTSYSGLAWQLGYQFDQRLSVFLSQRFFIQSPYFSVAVFDILPQNVLAIGLSYQLGP